MEACTGYALSLQRIHFAFTVTLHYVFPQLTMGLAPLIVIFKSLALTAHGAHYIALKTDAEEKTDGEYFGPEAYSLHVGLIWWLVGTALAIGYFTFLYRSFRGKVRFDEDGY